MSVLWCQGMFASGSTWLYNRTADALGLSAPGVRHVIKAHQARDGVERIADGWPR